MTDISTIINRLKKNKKTRSSILKSEQTNCFRLYEKDIPEYPYIVDIYGDHALIYEKGKKIPSSDYKFIETRRVHQAQIFEAIQKVMEISSNNIIIKTREVKKGKSQYKRANWVDDFFTVYENNMSFLVNLKMYIDTGLFLDHRVLRKWLLKDCAQKRVLNLFSYTGSLSVAAAMGGAQVTTIDLSKTYLEWAVKNFEINKIETHKHEFIQADLMEYIKSDLKESYDVILLDPPSFSNSKRMETTLDVQRDHVFLITQLMPHLNKNAPLYFSTNLRSFKLDNSICDKYNVEDITLASIPKDFRDKKIHKCFRIKNR